MGFQTPQYSLAKYLEWTRSGYLQLPDFQRGYKWDDERIRSLLATVLLGHPMGVVMLLRTGNDQVRFKPKPIEGSGVAAGTEPKLLLLDGQQRLTSLTQALTGDGIVATKDSRGKLMDRRYYLKLDDALRDPERMDDAVVSLPGDGVIRTNFNREIVLDLSHEEQERKHGYFPLRLLGDQNAATAWLFSLDDHNAARAMFTKIMTPVSSYEIPAIELDEATSRAAVATVFEKVNTGGLTLNVFELLTATFAGDPSYYQAHGDDFRLNDDWTRIREEDFLPHPVLAVVESTDFLQAVTLLTTRERGQAGEERSSAISARRADILKLTLDDYLRWRDPLREAFVWASTYLADHHVFVEEFVPYPKQLVPLAVTRVILGAEADAHAVRQRIDQWFWSGIFGERYGGSSETLIARDVEDLPGWAQTGEQVPRSVVDSGFSQSRLLTLRTRNAAAYKGIYALVLARGAKDWMYAQGLGRVQYSDLNVDIHHIFPRRWCDQHGIDEGRRDSIINKTAISATTNRAIGGKAPTQYLRQIQQRSQLDHEAQNAVIASHYVNADHLRRDDFEAFFAERAEELCRIIEKATGKDVPRDLDLSAGLDEFDPTDQAVRLADDEIAEDATETTEE